MKKNIFLFLMLLSFLLIAFISCQKSSSNTGNNSATETTYAAVSVSDNEADNIYNNVFDNVVSVNASIGLGSDGGVFGKSLHGKPDGAPPPPCYTVTIDTTASSNGFPKTVTLDFGSGCTGLDGHTRVGKITTVFSGPLSQTGSTATTTFQGYYVDSIHVDGTHIITNQSSGGTFIFSVQVQNGKLTLPSGNYIAWNKNRTWTQISGQGTTTLLDNSYSITGTSNGTLFVNDSTYQWTTNIINPCIRELICPWIVQGRVQLTWNTLSGVIDFGSGNCDNVATVDVEGKTFNITLR